MNTSNSNPTSTLDPFEVRLRADLHRLADHAPTSVDLTVPNQATLTANDSAGGRGRRVASIGAIVAVLAGGAGLTINGLQSADDPGGAATPDEAVQKFAEAFANEDVLGMADATVPEEAKALRAAADDGVAQAKRLNLVSQAFELDGIDGLDVEIEGLTLSDVSIDDQLVAVTSTGGTMTLSLDPDAVDAGDQTRAVSSPFVGESSATVDLAAEPVTLVAQRRGDRWYVSAGMSLAEAYVRSTGQPTPADPGIVPEGSPSPDAAANSFYARMANLDLVGATALVTPGEGDVFRRYSELWMPTFQSSIDSAKADGVEFTITTPIEYETVSDSDGRVILKPVKYGFDYASPQYDYTEVEMFDPTLETIVSTDNGDYLLPAGTPLPASIDDPIFGTVPFFGRDDEEALQELYGDESDYVERNYVWVMPDGTFETPTESVQGEVVAVDTTHVEAADGCMTVTLPEDMDSPDAEIMPTFGVEQIDAHTYRVCGKDAGLAGWFVLGLAGTGSPAIPGLPSIVVTDNGGEWFVSPIGTIAEMVIGPMRDIPDGAHIIDIPLAAGMSGLMGRDEFNESLAAGGGTGETGELSAECAAVTEPGPDGQPVLVADPDLDAYRACLDTFWMDYTVEEGSTVEVEVGSADAATAAPAAPVIEEVTGG